MVESESPCIYVFIVKIFLIRPQFVASKLLKLIESL